MVDKGQLVACSWFIDGQFPQAKTSREHGFQMRSQNIVKTLKNDPE